MPSELSCLSPTFRRSEYTRNIPPAGIPFPLLITQTLLTHAAAGVNDGVLFL